MHEKNVINLNEEGSKEIKLETVFQAKQASAKTKKSEVLEN